MFSARDLDDIAETIKRDIERLLNNGEIAVMMSVEIRQDLVILKLELDDVILAFFLPHVCLVQLCPYAGYTRITFLIHYRNLKLNI